MRIDRRLKRYRIHPDHLAGLLRGTDRVCERPLPDDAQVLSAVWDQDRYMLLITVHSLTFDVVEFDRDVPFSFNSPLFEGVGP